MSNFNESNSGGNMNKPQYTVVFQDQSKLKMGILLEQDDAGKKQIYIPEIDTVVSVDTKDLEYMYYLAKLLYKDQVDCVMCAGSVYPVIGDVEKLIMTTYINENENSDLKHQYNYVPTGYWYGMVGKLCADMYAIIVSYEKATSIQFKISHVDSSGLRRMVCQVEFFSDYYRQDLWTDQQEKEHRTKVKTPPALIWEVCNENKIIRHHLPRKNQVTNKDRYMQVALAKIYTVLESYLKTFE